MNKCKSIVLVLLLVLTVFILDHPIFGQLRPFQKKPFRKMEQQQLQLMPGLCIPQPSNSAPKALPLLPKSTTKPMVKVSHQQITQYFEQAAQAMNLPLSAPDFMNAFTISPKTPVVTGKGSIVMIDGVAWIWMSESDPGTLHYEQPGDDHHFVVFTFHAKKGFYLLNCDVDGYSGNYNAYIDAGSQNLTVSGNSDPQTGIFSFPVNIPQDCGVFITFDSPMNNWGWNGCEIIPQS